MKYYLYNPLSNNGLKPQINPSLKLLDATKTDYEQFFSSLEAEDEVVLIGGDGTINHLVNHYDCSKLKNKQEKSSFFLI
jgi:NAD kinase